MPTFFYRWPGDLRWNGPIQAQTKRHARAELLKRQGTLPRGLKLKRVLKKNIRARAAIFQRRDIPDCL